MRYDFKSFSLYYISIPIYDDWLIEQIKLALARPSIYVCHHQIIEGPKDIAFILLWIKGTDKLWYNACLYSRTESHTTICFITPSYWCVYILSMCNRFARYNSHISFSRIYDVIVSPITRDTIHGVIQVSVGLIQCSKPVHKHSWTSQQSLAMSNTIYTIYAPIHDNLHSYLLPTYERLWPVRIIRLFLINSIILEVKTWKCETQE